MKSRKRQIPSFETFHYPFVSISFQFFIQLAIKQPISFSSFFLSFFYSFLVHELFEIASRWMAGIVSSIQRYRYSGAASSVRWWGEFSRGLRVISGPNQAAISGGKAGSRQTVIPFEFKISLINTPRNEWYTLLPSFFTLLYFYIFPAFIAQNEADLRNICQSFVTD